jgi:hypothetical protein
MNYPNKNNQEILKSVLNICDIHVKRIESAYSHSSHLFPVSPETVNQFNEETLLNLEMLSSRFSKLQDLIGVKLFSLVLEISSDHDLSKPQNF